jgi:hypothetical protein
MKMTEVTLIDGKWECPKCGYTNTTNPKYPNYWKLGDILQCRNNVLFKINHPDCNQRTCSSSSIITGIYYTPGFNTNLKAPKFSVMDTVWVVYDCNLREKIVYSLSQKYVRWDKSIKTEYTVIDKEMLIVYEETKKMNKNIQKRWCDDVDMCEKIYPENKVFGSKAELINYLTKS